MLDASDHLQPEELRHNPIEEEYQEKEDDIEDSSDEDRIGVSASLNDRDSGDDDLTVRLPDVIGESSTTMQGTLRGASIAKTVLTT